jgi:hypothetical protein
MSCPLCLKKLVFDPHHKQWVCLDENNNHLYSSSYDVNNNFNYYMTFNLNIGEISIYSFINETIISINKKTTASYPAVLSCDALEFINRIINLKVYL